MRYAALQEYSRARNGLARAEETRNAAFSSLQEAQISLEDAMAKTITLREDARSAVSGSPTLAELGEEVDRYTGIFSEIQAKLLEGPRVQEYDLRDHITSEDADRLSALFDQLGIGGSQHNSPSGGAPKLPGVIYSGVYRRVGDGLFCYRDMEEYRWARKTALKNTDGLLMAAFGSIIVAGGAALAVAVPEIGAAAGIPVGMMGAVAIGTYKYHENLKGYGHPPNPFSIMSWEMERRLSEIRMLEESLFSQAA